MPADVLISKRPVVAVVGRPNVGKSTLVNRIVGRREAIVEERPGVTRDRKDLEAEWTGREFTVVDTGGWQSGGVALDKLVSAQAQRAIDEADAIMFVVDVTVGPTEQDAAVARLLLRSGTPVVLVVNKVDNEAREAEILGVRGAGFCPALAHLGTARTGRRRRARRPGHGARQRGRGAHRRGLVYRRGRSGTSGSGRAH